MKTTVTRMTTATTTSRTWMRSQRTKTRKKVKSELKLKTKGHKVRGHLMVKGHNHPLPQEVEEGLRVESMMTMMMMMRIVNGIQRI